MKKPTKKDHITEILAYLEYHLDCGACGTEFREYYEDELNGKMSPRQFAEKVWKAGWRRSEGRVVCKDCLEWGREEIS